MEINCRACNKPIKKKPGEIKPEGHLCNACYHSLPRPNRKTGTYKNCEICGKEFYTVAARPDAKFCGKKCKGIGSRLAIKACVVCGKEFKPVMGRSAQPCCSKKCGYVYRQDGKEIPCTFCGKPVYITQSRINATPTGRFFCSKEHADIWAGRNKTKHTCEMCNKEFYWSPSRSKAYNIKYCSIRCRDTDPQRKAMLIAMNADQQRMSPNHVEIIGYGILDTLGIEYEPQYLIAKKFCVDAFIPSMGIVVQFDGDYWHGNPAFFPTLDSRQQKRARLDISQDAYMKACGFTVIRIWASDLEKHTNEVIKRLQLLI